MYIVTMLLQGDYMICYLVVPGLPAAGAGGQLGRAYEHGAGAAHRARALHPRHRDTEDTAARLKYFFVLSDISSVLCLLPAGGGDDERRGWGRGGSGWPHSEMGVFYFLYFHHWAGVGTGHAPSTRHQ